MSPAQIHNIRFAKNQCTVSAIKIAIVEDEKMIGSSMLEFLTNDPIIECLGLYTNAESFMIDFESIEVDVVLIDINLPGKSGIECVAELKQSKPSVQFLMCTSFEEPENIFESLKVGATGYILKNASPDKLISAVYDIHRGGSPMSPEIARMVVQSFNFNREADDLLKTFSAREQEILQLLSKGYQYREIAQKLFISVETVRTYLRRIYENLQVRSKVEALNKVFPKK